MNHSDFLTALGWAVINSLWQFALLWVIYQLIIAFRPAIRAASRSAIASGMVIAGFAWFVFTLITFFKENIADAVPYMYGPGGWNHWIADALPVTSVIYLLLLTIPLFRFVRNYRYVQLIRTKALQKADVQLRLYVQKLSAQMGVRKKVELWVSDLVNSPVTIGYLRPVILLPVAAINHLSTQQVEAILLHELAHIRRFDYLLNLITKFIQSILYFNPFVKAFVRIIETEREKSCDEMVMQFQYDAHGYASALLTIEQINSVKHQVLTVAASGTRKHQLLGRIENILGINRNKGITGMRVAGIMLALSCMAIMHLVLQWKKPAIIGNTDNYLSYISSPHLFYNDRGNTLGINAVNHIAQTSSGENASSTNESDFASEAEQDSNDENAVVETDISDFSNIADFSHFVNNREVVLNEAQEAEVKKALESSTRVIKEIQWKNIEKSFADALTSTEKHLLREQLAQEAEKANLDKMGALLKQSYAEINWAALNAKLDEAVSAIRLDSLQSVYVTALAGLAELEKELVTSNVKSVPDSDISLKNIARKRLNVERLLNKVKETKERKIIKL